MFSMNFHPATWMRSVALGCLALLAACATPADVNNMVVGPDTVHPFPAPLRNAICLRTVTGGQETNPMMMSQVSDAGFRGALEGSLRENGLLALDACGFNLDANLLSLSQPMFGLDLRVSALVNYKLEDKAGAILLRETMGSAHTATFSDAAIGIMRLKLANEGAIRASIRDLFERLRELAVK